MPEDSCSSLSLLRVLSWTSYYKGRACDPTPNTDVSCLVESYESRSHHIMLHGRKSLPFITHWASTSETCFFFVLFWCQLLWNKSRTDFYVLIAVLLCWEFLYCFWAAVITPCKEHVTPSEWFHQHVAHDQLPRLSLGSCCVVHLVQHSFCLTISHILPSIHLCFYWQYSL